MNECNYSNEYKKYIIFRVLFSLCKDQSFCTGQSRVQDYKAWGLAHSRAFNSKNGFNDCNLNSHRFQQSILCGNTQQFLR